MGFRQIRTSDLTGEEIKDNEVLTVVVKSASKVFDTTAEEMAGLKRMTNVFELEYRYADKEPETVLCTKAEFEKVVSTEKLESFDSARGRRSGFSPVKNGS